MKVLSYVVGVAVAICGMSPVNPPASTVAADITGTWQVTVHVTPPSAATFVLKQDGVKITGTYDGYGGAEELTGKDQRKRRGSDPVDSQKGALVG